VEIEMFYGRPDRFQLSQGRIRDAVMGRWLRDEKDVVDTLNMLAKSLQQVRQQLEETRVELQHKDSELWDAIMRIQELQDKD